MTDCPICSHPEHTGVSCSTVVLATRVKMFEQLQASMDAVNARAQKEMSEQGYGRLGQSYLEAALDEVNRLRQQLLDQERSAAETRDALHWQIQDEQLLCGGLNNVLVEAGAMANGQPCYSAEFSYVEAFRLIVMERNAYKTQADHYRLAYEDLRHGVVRPC